VLKNLKAGEWPKPGSQSGRHTSEPAGELPIVEAVEVGEDPILVVEHAVLRIGSI
jgi:hypothetical protein